MAIEIEDVKKMLSDHGFEMSRRFGDLSGFYTKDGCGYYVYISEVPGSLDFNTDGLEVVSDILYFSDYQDIEEMTSAFEKLLQQFLMELL